MKYFFIFLLCLAFLSCKKGIEDSNSTQTPTFVPPPNSNLLNKNTYLVDSLSIQTVSVDGVEILKNKTALRPKIGDILLASASNNNPYGFLRKVISVSENSSTIICSTELSSLNDAFTQLHIDTTISNDYASNYAYRGAAIGFSFNNNTSLFNGLKVDGNIKVNMPSVTFSYGKEAGSLLPEKIILQAELNTIGSSLSITNSTDNSVIIASEKVLKSILLPPLYFIIPVVIPPLPIPIPVRIAFLHELSFKILPAKVTGKASWTIRPVLNATIGTKYTTGSWQSLNSLSYSGNTDSLKRSDFTPTVSLNSEITIFNLAYSISPFNEKLLQASIEIPTNLIFVGQPVQTPNFAFTLQTSADFKIKTKVFTGSNSELKFSLSPSPWLKYEGNWKDTLNPWIDTLVGSWKLEQFNKVTDEKYKEVVRNYDYAIQYGLCAGDMPLGDNMVHMWSPGLNFIFKFRDDLTFTITRESGPNCPALKDSASNKAFISPNGYVTTPYVGIGITLNGQLEVISKDKLRTKLTPCADGCVEYYYTLERK